MSDKPKPPDNSERPTGEADKPAPPPLPDEDSPSAIPVFPPARGDGS